MTDKTQQERHISTLDYFNRLQEEYFICNLRARIYPRVKDKSYWRKVAEFKKDKIESIAERNNLASIFSDVGVHSEIYFKTIPTSCYPNFTYKTEDYVTKDNDFIHYYAIDSDVKIVEDWDKFSETGILISIDLEENTGKVKTSKGTIESDLTKIVRII